jgi:hypothetical protein
VFIKILKKEFGGKKHFYASLVENNRVDGRVVQTVKAHLGPVSEEQIPYLKAAYSKRRPRLVYDQRSSSSENIYLEKEKDSD